MVESCPVCGSGDRSDVLSLPRMPVLINAQVRPEDAQSVTRGDIDLVACHVCGHLYNRSFDESLLDYDAAYENTLHFSPAFQEFAARLADRLIRDHDLVGKDVAEFGSGPGHFLSLLCERGVARGLGYDPSYDPWRLGAPEHEAVSISTEPFPDDGTVPAALVYSQHVLEHLHDPVAALAAQRAAVAHTGGTVYSEVPNGAVMVEQCALWDLIYEHLSYFTPTSLELVCRLAGLNPTVIDVAFGGQFLWCAAEAGTVGPASPDAALVEAAVGTAREFGKRATGRISEARADLARWAAEGPVVIWGAGSKGMTYLNLVADEAAVAGVIDVNPRKFGWGVPGTDFVISEPAAVRNIQPSTIVAANPLYVDEIREAAARLGVVAHVLPLWG